MEKELADKLHYNPGFGLSSTISTEIKCLFQPLIRINK